MADIDKDDVRSIVTRTERALAKAMAAYLGVPEATSDDVVGHDLRVVSSPRQGDFWDELSYYADGSLVMTVAVDYRDQETRAKFDSPFVQLEGY